jgi:DNA end-binding protein Ku
VRSMKELSVEAVPVSEPELKLAQQLIDQLAAKRFDPNEYHDEFKGRVEAAIERKVHGKEISLAEAPVANANGNVIDLMQALKASIGAKRSAAGSRERKPPKRAAEPAGRKSARR